MSAEKGNGPHESGVGENRLPTASSRQGSGCKTRKKEPRVQKGRRPTGNGSGVVLTCSSQGCHKYHKLSGFNNSNLFSHCSGVQMSEIKLWAGSVPLLRAVRTIFSVPLILVSGSLLTIFGVPWIVDTAPHSFPSSSYGILPVTKFPPFYKGNSHPNDLILINCICNHSSTEDQEFNI